MRVSGECGTRSMGISIGYDDLCKICVICGLLSEHWIGVGGMVACLFDTRECYHCASYHVLSVTSSSSHGTSARLHGDDKHGRCSSPSPASTASAVNFWRPGNCRAFLQPKMDESSSSRNDIHNNLSQQTLFALVTRKARHTYCKHETAGGSHEI